VAGGDAVDLGDLARADAALHVVVYALVALANQGASLDRQLDFGAAVVV